MFCPKCGKEKEEEASFCLYCGTNLQVATVAPSRPRPTPLPPNVEEKKQEPAPASAEKPLSSFVESMNKDLRQRLFFEGESFQFKDEQGKEYFTCNPGLEGFAIGFFICKKMNFALCNYYLTNGLIYPYIERQIKMLPVTNPIRIKIEQDVLDASKVVQLKDTRLSSL